MESPCNSDVVSVLKKSSSCPGLPLSFPVTQRKPSQGSSTALLTSNNGNPLFQDFSFWIQTLRRQTWSYTCSNIFDSIKCRFFRGSNLNKEYNSGGKSITMNLIYSSTDSHYDSNGDPRSPSTSRLNYLPSPPFFNTSSFTLYCCFHFISFPLLNTAINLSV